MRRHHQLLLAILLGLSLLLPAPSLSAVSALAQGIQVEPQDITIKPADLPPGFTVSKEQTEPMTSGAGIIYFMSLERPLTEEAAASGPIFVTQVIGRFDRPTSYEGFLDELRRSSMEKDGYELVPNAPNDGGTASLQKMEGQVASFQVGFIKRDMVIFTGWIGRKGVVTLPGLLTLAGVSSARYDDVLASRSAPPAEATAPAGQTAPSVESPAPAAPASSSAPPPSRGRITNTGGAGANVRSRPEVAGTLIVVAQDGETVELLGPEEAGADGRQWRNIRTGSGETGWVVAEYVSTSAADVSASPPPSPPPSPTARPARPQPTPTPAPAPGRSTASGLSIPTAYIYPKIAPPMNDHQFICLQMNPSCSRDPWWVVWSEVQSDALVQFSFLVPGLVAEERFIEAIWLIWQWDEGKRLLRAAAEHGVTIRARERIEDALGAYGWYHQALVVNRRFTETSTWMVADVLAHELQHVVDHKLGRIPTGPGPACFAVEREAYGVERRYLVWLSKRFGGLPNPVEIAGRLSEEDFVLYANLYEIGTSPDLDAAVRRDYRQSCLR